LDGAAGRTATTTTTTRHRVFAGWIAAAASPSHSSARVPWFRPGCKSEASTARAQSKCPRPIGCTRTVLASILTEHPFEAGAIRHWAAASSESPTGARMAATAIVVAGGEGEGEGVHHVGESGWLAGGRLADDFGRRLARRLAGWLRHQHAHAPVHATAPVACPIRAAARPPPSAAFRTQTASRHADSHAPHSAKRGPPAARLEPSPHRPTSRRRRCLRRLSARPPEVRGHRKGRPPLRAQRRLAGCRQLALLGAELLACSRRAALLASFAAATLTSPASSPSTTARRMRARWPGPSAQHPKNARWLCTHAPTASSAWGPATPLTNTRPLEGQIRIAAMGALAAAIRRDNDPYIHTYIST